MPAAVSYRLGVAAGRLATVSKQAMNGVGRAGLATAAQRTAQAQPSYTQVPKYLVEKMKHFQQPNNLPVHLKGGPVDKILFVLTAGVCTVGIIDCFRVYYALSYPKQS